MLYDEQDQYISKLRKLEAENARLKKAFQTANIARNKAEKENEEVREWGRKKHERIQELEQELRQMHVRTVDAEKHAEQMQMERDWLALQLQWWLERAVQETAKARE